LIERPNFFTMPMWSSPQRGACGCAPGQITIDVTSRCVPTNYWNIAKQPHVTWII